jgi:hypothetical protein
MPISEETRNVLEEMRKNGVDTTILAGLERELDSKPNADKVVKDGIMAQSTFNSYRTKKDEEIRQLKENLTKLASLQASSGNLDGDLKTTVEAQIAAKEQELVAQGYDIEQVRELVGDLLSNPASINKLNTNEPPIEKKDEKVMPNTDDKKYVDAHTLSNVLLESGANIAKGNIIVTTQIARAMREAEKLGIDVTDEKFGKFAETLITGLETGKTPDLVMDEFFGFSTVRQEKAKIQRDAELKEAEEKGRREALKEVGVNPRRSLRDPERNPNPILDRKREEKLDSRITEMDKLPKNEKGEPEVFRMRRFDRNQRRHEHTQNAVNRYDEVRKDYDDDGLYIGHRQPANI